MLIVVPYPYNRETCGLCGKPDVESGKQRDFLLCSDNKYSILHLIIPLCPKCMKRATRKTIAEAVELIITAIVAVGVFCWFTWWRWQAGRISTWGILVAGVVAAVLNIIFRILNKTMFGTSSLPDDEYLNELEILKTWGWQEIDLSEEVKIPGLDDPLMLESVEQAEELLQKHGITKVELEDMGDYSAFFDELSATGCEILKADEENL